MSDTGAHVICTVGMHRSGTSLVSRLLNLLGVCLGPEARLSSTGADNPKGYWEHRSFVAINDEILGRFGGRWDAPPALVPGWPRDPRLVDLTENARRLVDQDFAGVPLWGWKDPRTCLTLPFWQDVVGPMRYVICIRSPQAVVASLVRRNGMSPGSAERLWRDHVKAGLAHTSDQPRMIVFYEDILDDWRSELRRMAVFLGHAERAEDERVHHAATSFIDDELCHHRASLEEIAADQRIAFPTVGLYLALRGHAGSQQALDLLAARLIENGDQAAAMSAELQEIHTSRAFGLALLLGRAALHLLPPGTRRRRAFDAVLGRTDHLPTT